jgi:hypothetical protein
LILPEYLYETFQLKQNIWNIINNPPLEALINYASDLKYFNEKRLIQTISLFVNRTK